jgi:hypothetical protein
LLKQSIGMRIGSDDNWLEIEKVGSTTPVPLWRFAVAATGADWKLTASCEQTLLCAAAEIRNDIADFTALRKHQVDLVIANRGWLLIRRHITGFALVRYRLTHTQTGGALEGEIRLDAEAAKAFCGGLNELLCPA